MILHGKISRVNIIPFFSIVPVREEKRKIRKCQARTLCFSKMVDVYSLRFQNRTCSGSATQDLECGTKGSVHVDYPPCRMFVLMKSLTSLKMGHVGSKTRVLGQILEKIL